MLFASFGALRLCVRKDSISKTLVASIESTKTNDEASSMRAATMIDRILDANFNRLAEGLRVIEDMTRFGLDDAALAERLKRLRHEVGQLRRAMPGDLLGARDSLSDVGRVQIKEPTCRAEPSETLAAAFGRSREAARAIEEMAKLRGGVKAARVKAIRYAIYELERVVTPLFDRRERLAGLRGLYLILTDPVVGYEALAEIAVEAKVAAIQLRAKNMDGGAMVTMARRLRAIARGGATLFFVNDRPDVARLAEADGVHVGQDDLSVADARAIVGPGMLVGKSTHNARQFRQALAEKADYVAIGPVFGTASKANPDPVVGLERAGRRAGEAAQAGVTAVAIGGITAERLPSVLAAGFDAYALIAEVGGSAKPLAAIRRLRRVERAATNAERGTRNAEKAAFKPARWARPKPGGGSDGQ
jgi:thiamine-phosphate pyrophosphorylase